MIARLPAPAAGAIAAGLIVLATPLWLLRDTTERGRAPVAAPSLPPPRAIEPAPAVGEAPARPLFSAAPADPLLPEAGSPPAAGPDLVGIVGRLPDDAVALVRGGNGGTQMVAIGGQVEGWRLAALSPDAALFVRGAERLRVGLPAEAAPDPAQ
ncbi:hypothetical protein [Sphingomonas profundi]|uniref:hypothetical protein n=1 Tax=Alterirhizorhabdus profundi TaxID=2681549 RepID=UPI0012E728CF|nr:hypothetical protein [Sphingomonas profundi]